MIEAYIAASRFSRPASASLSEGYSEIFEFLTARLGDGVPKPEFFVTYSMNRVCENVRIGGAKYIIYDQYMGQSIAQLNRILFFGREPDELMMAYAFKVQAEEAFLKGDFKRALFFAMSRQKAYEDLGDRRYSAARLSASDRLNIGVCQECFVIGHELAHQATDSPLFTEELIEGEWSEVHDYFDRLLETSRPFSDDLMSPTHRKLHEAYRKKLSTHSIDEKREAWRRILARVGRDIVPEIVSDRLACELTLKVMIEDMGLSPFLAHLGTLLAFRYMRIFQYLRNAATFLREAEPWSPDDKDAVETVENNMLHYLMGGPTGLQSLAAWQVREKLLRRELFQGLSGLGLEELSRVDKAAQKHIFFCEENMDHEMSYFLPFGIARGAPLYHADRLEIGMSDARRAAAQLLGWA